MGRPSLVTVVARPLLAATFVNGGWRSLRDPAGLIGLARKAGVPAADVAVPATSAAMVGGGVALSLGIAPVTSAATLTACLAGATYGVHGFWREQEPGPRAIHRAALLTNVAVAAGLLLVAADARARG
ncbi:DoxX family protein [Patulibacter defluvii]|uniref:DoxX family protein n=1 Tax=Patulibacter defluvii TaxID=3095358 RepID=UPI002A74A070|nr:DoxX family protein [Patulibacter sp. DM4]